MSKEKIWLTPGIHYVKLRGKVREVKINIGDYRFSALNSRNNGTMQPKEIK